MWENIEEMFPDTTLQNFMDLPFDSTEDVLRAQPPKIVASFLIQKNECYTGTEQLTWYSDGTFERKLLDSIYPKYGPDGVSAINAYGWKMLNKINKTQRVFKPRYEMEQTIHVEKPIPLKLVDEFGNRENVLSGSIVCT